MTTRSRFREIIHHSYLTFGLGLLLTATGLAEIWQAFGDGAGNVIGAHHGVTAYGFVTMVRALSTLREGADETLSRS